MNALPSSRRRSDLLSQQVSGGCYFFLRLTAANHPRMALAFGGRETCNPDYAIQRSSYAYHVLEYVAEGAGQVRLGNRAAALLPGSVFSYPPEMRCEMRTDPLRPMVKYFLCLTGPGVPARLARAGIGPAAVRQLAAHAEVRSLWEDLIREGRHHGRLTAQSCAALLEVLLLKLEDLARRAARRGNVAEDRFLRCKAMIDSRIEETRSLEEIARAIGVRPSSVCRLFRRFQGTSPYQYLLRRKMILAAENLVETGALVQETAQRVGFTDPFHFSRCFRAVHGVSPSHLRAYRRSV